MQQPACTRTHCLRAGFCESQAELKSQGNSDTSWPCQRFQALSSLDGAINLGWMRAANVALLKADASLKILWFGCLLARSWPTCLPRISGAPKIAAPDSLVRHQGLKQSIPVWSRGGTQGIQMGSRVRNEADQGLSASTTVSKFRYYWQVQNEIPRISSWACQRSGGFPCPYTLHGRATRGAGSCALSVELDCSPVYIWVDQWRISTTQLLLRSPAVIRRSQHWFCLLGVGAWPRAFRQCSSVPDPPCRFCFDVEVSRSSISWSGCNAPTMLRCFFSRSNLGGCQSCVPGTTSLLPNKR